MLSLSIKGQKRKLLRYIFCNLEADESGIEVNEDSFSIEHILPEVPTDEWRQNFTDVQIEEMVYRLGNLTLLEPSFNRDIGQKNYSIKLEKYHQSVYCLTKNIMAEDWTPDAMAARQRNLARRAVHVWKSDFS
ncbi:HNH endonuclease family protein [Tychonema sp. BBK16]|uniref:HNH endonuclease family protein n=1 Tax=Tychonema sp. BBK16 TaxID=2699888 RepID=UPI001F2C8471|nr:HNH endonuclease family protein [Tychonema sp. BBK16]MCF6373838.1 HNH endonuclease family protein [Tychonema sp. BBK16]